MTHGHPEAGTALELQVVSGHVVPCDHCGIPCTGTVLFWYVDGQQRVALEVDRPTLSDVFDVILQKAIAGGAYPQLPRFVRDWNEQVGWAAQDFDEPTAVEVSEVLSTVDLVTTGQAELEARLRSFLGCLRDFASKCGSERRTLWVCET